MERIESAQRRSNCFDFLRLFAAFTVVVSHAVLHLHHQVLWVRPGFGYWFYEGVPLFFILSGFLVYRSCAKCMDGELPIRNYFTNRFLRIAPAIYAYVIVTTLLVVVIGAVAVDTLLRPKFSLWLLASLFLVPLDPRFQSFAPHGLNGSLWTIPTEVSFYVAVPVLILIERRFGFRSLMLLVGVAAFIGLILRAYLLSMHPVPAVYKVYQLTFPPYLLFFGLGIFWLRMWHRVPRTPILALLALAVYMALRTFNVLHVSDYLNPVFAFAWAIPLSYVVMYAGHYGPRLLQAIPEKIGDLSYGVYIWHMVVINFALWYRLPDKLAGVPGGLQVFVLAATFLAAILSWNLVERRALRLKPFTSRSREGMRRPYEPGAPAVAAINAEAASSGWMGDAVSSDTG